MYTVCSFEHKGNLKIKNILIKFERSLAQSNLRFILCLSFPFIGLKVIQLSKDLTRILPFI